MADGTIEKFRGVRGKVISQLEGLRWLALLLGRLSVGLVFLSTGWGKIHNIAGVTAFFTKLGIPAPGFHAVFVGYTELLCGLALVVGLCSRLATIPLIVSMIVAILTAKLSDLHNLFDLVAFDEFTYIMVMLMIAILGPGSASLDTLIARRIEGAPTEKKLVPWGNTPPLGGSLRRGHVDAAPVGRGGLGGEGAATSEQDGARRVLPRLGLEQRDRG
jgi:putative oxidoreductase